MKYAIISDLHSNLEALTAVLDKIDGAGVDRIVCLGDVVGYNANPNECVSIMRERAIPTICGNHDAVACGMAEPWGFNPIALAAALWTRENLTPASLDWLRSLPDSRRFEDFLAVHGSPMDRDTYMFGWEDILPHLDYLREQDCSLCFFGHTHFPGIFSADGVYTVDDDSRFHLREARGDREGTDDTSSNRTARPSSGTPRGRRTSKEFFINPGSVGQPRDGDPRAAYGILDTAKGEYELVRVPYPIKQAAERAIAAGLPHFLAERLYLGR